MSDGHYGDCRSLLNTGIDDISPRNQGSNVVRTAHCNWTDVIISQLHSRLNECELSPCLRLRGFKG